MVLQQSVVSEGTFELMKSLMSEEKLKYFFLVGGTNLALRLGHRKSIDIDMFTRNDIDVPDLQRYLYEKYRFKESFRAKNTLKGEINEIKIDLIKYDYNFLKPIEEVNNIRLSRIEDIIAMKLSAITDSGTRVKDFTDISFLSTKFSLNQMLDFYSTKFSGANIFSAAKALVYFDDIDFSNGPVELISADFKWEKINKRLVDMTQNPEKIFDSKPIDFSSL